MHDLKLLSEGKFEEAIRYFRSLPEAENTDHPKNGDTLFGKYGPGNVAEQLDKPYERFHDYEQLLLAMQAIDATKYNNLHKGTPFYFLAWLAFDLRNYTKGLFYIDAAIAEDMRHQLYWRNGSAIKFYTLESVDYLSGRTVGKMDSILSKHLHNFSTLQAVPSSLNKQNFVTGFVEKLISDTDHTKRSIISAFYVFLLEFEDLYNLLKVRTAYGGSILPFITHLFTGGVIFESLLKEVYPLNNNGASVKTLGEIFKTTTFQQDYNINIDTGSTSLSSILSYANSTNSAPTLQETFTVVTRLRNTTGHNIVWDDIFKDPENFKKLFEQEVYAILYVIAKKF